MKRGSISFTLKTVIILITLIILIVAGLFLIKKNLIDGVFSILR